VLVCHANAWLVLQEEYDPTRRSPVWLDAMINIFILMAIPNGHRLPL
jgi:hypothetical protein